MEGQPPTPKLPASESPRGSFTTRALDFMDFPRSASEVADLVPLIKTVSTYDVRKNLMGDLTAGLTVGVMLVPQGMAYALLATLPPEYGLYSAIVPIIIYAVFGTSRHLAVGPVAIASLLVAEALEGAGVHDTYEKVEFAFILAFFVGLISALMGLLRAGVLATFLSHSVLIGFTGGAAVTIALSQLKHLLGFKIESFSMPIETLFYALGHLDETNPTTITMGLLSIVYLLVLRVAKQKFGAPRASDSPNVAKARVALGFFASLGALQVVIIGTLVSKALYENHGYGPSDLPIVGDVPAGMPAPAAPDFGLLGDNFADIFVSALVIAILGFMESYAVSDRFARKHDYEVAPNRELFALGAANMVGSFFGAFPVTGGFSRTAVNEGAGAATVLASIVSAIIVLFVAFVLTDSFFYMPKNVLAAIVFVAVAGLFDLAAMRSIWRVSRRDFAVMLGTLLATLILGTEIGLAVGVGCSVFALLSMIALPHTAVLGLVASKERHEPSGEEREGLYRNVRRFPDATTTPNVLVFRVDASLSFANMNHVQRELTRARQRTPLNVAGAQHRPAIVLLCDGINNIDAAGLEALHDMQHDTLKEGLCFVAAAVKGPVRDAIERENAFLAGKKQTPLLPWLHKREPLGADAKPVAFMVASVPAALHALQKSADLESQEVDDAEEEEDGVRDGKTTTAAVSHA